MVSYKRADAFYMYVGSERSYRLRSLAFRKRPARTSAGINHHILEFRGAVLTYAIQESDCRFTCNLSGCLCAVQAEKFMP